MFVSRMGARTVTVRAIHSANDRLYFVINKLRNSFEVETELIVYYLVELMLLSFKKWRLLYTRVSPALTL
jgi:predicted glycosyl hydrolase (DUF1957 family)